MGRRDCDLSARAGKVVKRFERWRSTRGRPTRIPPPLWAAAVDLACTFGVSPVARLLRLDYYSLERRVEARDAGDEGAGLSFVEVDMVPSSSTEGCEIEFSAGDGAKMLIRGCSSCNLDLEGLLASFLGRAR